MTPQKTNDHLLTQALQKLTGLDSRGLSVTAYFEQLDMLPECRLRVPFLFRKFIVVYEKMPVIHEIMSPKPSSKMLDILGDAPGSPFLITDMGGKSVDSLYVVTQRDIDDKSSRDWFDTMSHARVVMNDHPRFGCLFAAALTSFSHV